MTPAAILPADHAEAMLIGRAWIPARNGPVPVLVKTDALYDLSDVARTASELLELEDPVASIRSAAPLPRIADLAAVLANSQFLRRNPGQPWLLAPCNLQGLKASGVTFVASMLERVIEEQARGDASRAEAIHPS